MVVHTELGIFSRILKIIKRTEEDNHGKTWSKPIIPQVRKEKFDMSYTLSSILFAARVSRQGIPGSNLGRKGVGPSTTLAWPGRKQPDIPVEVDTARLATCRFKNDVAKCVLLYYPSSEFENTFNVY
jgi:hypothetical protein